VQASQKYVDEVRGKYYNTQDNGMTDKGIRIKEYTDGSVHNSVKRRSHIDVTSSLRVHRLYMAFNGPGVMDREKTTQYHRTTIDASSGLNYHLQWDKCQLPCYIEWYDTTDIYHMFTQ
jgi:hypothetical protein